jgi:hypothetical protein
LQEITVESSKTKKTSLATVRETAAATRTQSLLETAAEIVEPAVQASSSSEDVTHSFSEAGTDERMTNSLAGWSSDLSLTDDSENFDPTSPEANNLALMCGMQSLKKDLKMINFRLQSIEQLLSTSKCMVNLTL